MLASSGCICCASWSSLTSAKRADPHVYAIQVFPLFHRTMHSSDLVYLPPEDVKELVSRNGQVVLPTRPSYSSDIFAFGSIVYELVTLESPFKNSSPLSIIWQVGNGRSQCLSLLQRGRFKGLISRCWATCQYRRPSFKQIISTVADSLILPRDIHSKFSTSVPNDLCTLGRWNAKADFVNTSMWNHSNKVKLYLTRAWSGQQS